MYRAVWRQLECLYRVAHQVDIVKLVIFDLDDTLWRGLIAEHYADGVPWPVINGWPVGIWETVQHLRGRGIITAICSKNEESIVRSRWGRGVLIEQWLSLDDFPLYEINWEPKAVNIGKLIERASVTPKSVLFVDDNPVERASVKAAFPAIRAIGSNPYETRRILLWSPETQIGKRSRETDLRETSIRRMQVREKERASMSRDEFLSSLECRVSLELIELPTHGSFARGFELINKTNQFNTLGRRWTNTELTEFFYTNGKMYTFKVNDKYTDYGLVGVLLYREGHFIQFVMSCRVLGLEIETSVINFIMLHDPNQSEAFRAQVVETEANMVCRGVFARSGFEEQSPGDFVFSGAIDPKRISAHLTIDLG
jgi:FkbH-like protein